MKTLLKTITILLLSNLLVSGLSRAENNILPASGDLLSLKDDSSISGVKADHNAVLSLWKDGNMLGLKIDYTAANRYPGASFPCPPGGLDLSAFTGIKAEVTNAGSTSIRANLRVDNEGDWQLKPWNAEHVAIEPGESKTLLVTFGKTYGAAGYALDPKHVTRVMIFTDTAPEDGALIVKSLQAVK